MTGTAVLVTALAIPSAILWLTAWNIARSAWRSLRYRGWYER